MGFFSCRERPGGIKPKVITQAVPHDTDDPAIWINRQDPAASIVFGTDKETDGAIFAFDLEGRILERKVIHGVQRPNNVDVEYGFTMNGVSHDILAFTEREREQVRIFSVPDMQPLDNGGFSVFRGEPEGYFQRPMGIGIYKHPVTDSVYLIIGRKDGPTDGTYLWQYVLRSDSTELQPALVRKFGAFSGKKEIEAVAVDDELGFIYYADEGVGIRKYHADPTRGDEELALFGTEGFADDMEGIAILATGPGKGYILVSDQQGQAVRVFDRSGGHAFVKSIPIQAVETDGLEVSGKDLGKKFPRGLLVAMSEGRVFHYYSMEQLGLGERPRSGGGDETNTSD